ncbi:hypothetical protein B0A50_02657 [Salinomyces thailandicus]|uniref:Uncharacterized protein n=1 Tax=Salinomyces thailandicus TaxID=706561 RepID=A0A4U0U5K0_9PEZI|nr:hypothetical protein B0A50_02657 [Salinomyces thailandica]
MSFPLFSGRSALRRLHQTVRRNISRRHQARFESSKQTFTGNGGAEAGKQQSKQWTIPGPGWGWIEPLGAPLRAYGNMQKRSPILTQLESTLIIYYLGDVSAQIMQTNAFADASYEPARGLKALTIGLISSIPSYKWFLFLGRHFNYSSHLVSIGVKILVNQTVFTPVFNTYFFGMQSLLSGSTLEEAKRRVFDTVPVSWRNSWKVWPLVTAFSFTFIPPQSRSVFAGVIAIFWQTYLSWLNKNAEAGEKGRAQADEGTAKVDSSKSTTRG